MSFIIDKIENIRNKPKSTRRKIAVFLALFLTLILFITWFYTLPSEITKTMDYEIPNEEIYTVDTFTPLTNIKEELNNFGQIFNNLSSQFESTTTSD